ncbi:hypothetical protein GCM10009117_07680 [Gangjinia marincola]|uniref:RiboL-PSP-HEPN domain-containing protein n=1 Tax=Gangjinia marincola TaxID=578463 RepID=A0ABN1MER7_9FLAO
MPKFSTTIRREFSNRLIELNNTRANFELAFSNGTISDTDIIQGYAGLYLDLFTEFESLIEKLFLGILSGSVSHTDGTVDRKVSIKPVTEVEIVIKGEKRTYVDWLPYKENTLKRAKIYFVDARPFSDLTVLQKNKLANFHKIRNAIAHKSQKVSDQFQAIIQGLTLLPVEKTPAGYLRNIPNSATGMTQLEIISDELLGIANNLCT